jgi:hypothetical protein
MLHVVLISHNLTCCSGVRPFGVSLLIAGYDDNGPQLYQVCAKSCMIDTLLFSFPLFQIQLHVSFYLNKKALYVYYWVYHLSSTIDWSSPVVYSYYMV